LGTKLSVFLQLGATLLTERQPYASIIQFSRLTSIAAAF
jgi:hypothetical protein